MHVTKPSGTACWAPLLAQGTRVGNLRMTEMGTLSTAAVIAEFWLLAGANVSQAMITGLER